jgi:hypothetical protein
VRPGATTATRVRSLGLTKKRLLASARVARGVLGFRGALGHPGLSSDTRSPSDDGLSQPFLALKMVESSS